MKRVMLCMLAMILILTAGCGRKKEADDESVEEAGILTGVFRETARYTFGSGELYYPMTGGVYRDPVSGALTVFEVQTGLDENTAHATLDARLRTTSPDGETLSTVDLPREEADLYLYCCGAYVTAERAYWLNCLPSDGVRRVTLHAADPDGGNHMAVPMDDAFSASALEALTAHFDFHFAAAPDGTVWIAAEDEIVCLSPSLEKMYSVTAPAAVTDLGLTPEGVLLFGCGDETDSYNTTVIYRLDGNSRQYTQIRDIAGEAGSGRFGVKLFFGPGYDYYYEETRREKTPGIVGVKDGVDTLVLNRNNSGVEEKWTSLLAVVDPELVLYQQLSETGVTTLIAYGHAPDIDLSDIPTIEIACANWFSFSDLEAKAARWNRDHPELHVTVTQRVNQKTYYEDTDKLIFELGNGFYKPDIILGQCGGPVLTTVLQKNLWTDLSPLMDRDPLVNRDNLFDSVEKLFSTEDGKLWGLTPEFSVSTMIGRRDVLGKYAEKGSWTLNEFIDFARSLPEGTLLSPYITKRYFGPMLGTAGFDHWIDYDAASCHFEDEDFLAFLSFFRDLPDGPDDIKKKYHFGETVVSGADFMQEYQYYQSGQVALSTSPVSTIEDLLYENDLKFGTTGTDDLVYMGCPTSAEDGLPANDLIADLTYVITSYCADPGSAWDVIRSFFDVTNESGFLHYTNFPALISEFDELADGWKSHWYFISPDRKHNRLEEKGEEEIDRAALGIPEDSMAVTMTDEDYRRIRDFLDSEAGTPAVDYTPDGITDIILEEIDVMLGKGSSEADCAKMIQSRVSIWLAENK